MKLSTIIIIISTAGLLMSMIGFVAWAFTGSYAAAVVATIGGALLSLVFLAALVSGLILNYTGGGE